MNHINLLDAITKHPGSKCLVVVEQSKSLRFQLAASVVMGCWSKNLPVRHIVLQQANCNHQDPSVELLSLVRSNINLPFLWALEIKDRAQRDSFLDCIASMAALVVARSRDIQGLMDFAKATVRREWASKGDKGSFSKIMNEIGRYVAPTQSQTFVDSLEKLTDPSIQKSMNYLGSGLILLKDFSRLHSDKEELGHTESVAVIDEASRFMGAHRNSDDFYSAMFGLSKQLNHSLILLCSHEPTQSVIDMVGHGDIITGSSSIAA